MRANNPSAAAKAELACIWPETPKPHVLVSVGTGFPSQSPTDMGAPRGLIWDGFISRVFRGFMSSPFVDSDNGWLSVIDRLSREEKQRHIRLSFEFVGDAPALDDAPAMTLLERQSNACRKDYSAVVRLLWASRFFIEFQSEPVYYLGEYHCKATILFRGDDIRPLVALMCQTYQFPQIKAGNRVVSRLHRYDGVCVTCGRFQQQLDFSVRRLDENISLILAYESALTAPIQGHNKPVHWFLQRQMLNGHLRRWPSGSLCCQNQGVVADNGLTCRGRKRKAAEIQ